MVVDLIVILIIVMSGVAGFAKGFLRTVLGMMGGLVAMVISLYLANKLVDVVDTYFGIRDWLTSMFHTQIISISPEIFGELATSESILSGLEEFGLPTFLAQIVVPWLESLLITDSGLTIAQTISVAASNIVLFVAASSALYALLRLLIGLLDSVIEKRIFSSRPTEAADRFGGLVLGIARGIVFSIIAGVVIVTLITIPTFAEIGRSFLTKAESGFLAKYIIQLAYYIITLLPI